MIKGSGQEGTVLTKRSYVVNYDINKAVGFEMKHIYSDKAGSSHSTPESVPNLLNERQTW